MSLTEDERKKFEKELKDGREAKATQQIAEAFGAMIAEMETILRPAD